MGSVQPLRLQIAITAPKNVNASETWQQTEQQKIS